MGQLQPLQDTFSALAGVPVRQTTRPGETFEHLESRRESPKNSARIRLPILGTFVKALVFLQHIQ